MSNQRSLFDETPPSVHLPLPKVTLRRRRKGDDPPPQKHFNGSDYERERDDTRLRGQQLRLWELMRDQQWRTLGQIARSTGDPEASISAQLRHLRKPRFGSHIVEKEYLGSGLFQYRLLPPRVRHGG